MKINDLKKLGVISLLPFFIMACELDSTSSTNDLNIETNAVDKSLFIKDGLVGDITEEDCTLSGGTKTTCYRFSVKSEPTEHKMGPWCPPNISSSDTEGGIWLEDGKVNQVDGSFIKNLSTFYDDSSWKLYNDETGKVNITDTKESCEGAAKPDVDEEYQNHCVQCETSYLEEGAVITYMVPKKPIPSKSDISIGRSGVGVAFNGVIFDAPAPTDAILAAHTLAPFDDCGGHVNLHNGYHYHAATGCSKQIEQEDNHSGMIGYALDGFPLYNRLDKDDKEPEDLDSCSGHTDSIRGYHYHVADAGANQFIGCFKAEYGCVYEGDAKDQVCDASAVSNGPPGDRPEGGPPGGRPEFETKNHSHAKFYSHGHSH